MSNKITISDILNSACGPLNQHLNQPVKSASNKPKKPKKSSKEKKWINTQIWAWCQEKGLKFETELKNWHPARKWRFDWAIPSMMIAIEYEGIYSDISRHTTVNGYSEDADKYRAAAILGWIVLRYTSKNYKSMLSDLDKIFSEKK